MQQLDFCRNQDFDFCSLHLVLESVAQMLKCKHCNVYLHWLLICIYSFNDLVNEMCKNVVIMLDAISTACIQIACNKPRNMWLTERAWKMAQTIQLLCIVNTSLLSYYQGHVLYKDTSASPSLSLLSCHWDDGDCLVLGSLTCRHRKAKRQRKNIKHWHKCSSKAVKTTSVIELLILHPICTRVRLGFKDTVWLKQQI